MKIIWMIGVIILMCALGVAYDMVFSSKSLSKKAHIEQLDHVINRNEWEYIPQVPLQTIDGRSFSLQDYKGKIVILNFWASWCPACSIEFPSLLKLIRKFQGDITLISVSIDDKEIDIQNFLKSLDAEFNKELTSPQVLIAWDKDRSVTTGIFQTLKLPEAIILTKDQRMARKVIGSFDWGNKDLENFLKQLIRI